MRIQFNINNTRCALQLDREYLYVLSLKYTHSEDLKTLTKVQHC